MREPLPFEVGLLASRTPASAIAPPISSAGPGISPSQTSEIPIAAAGTRYRLTVTRPTSIRAMA